jgi:hypothetical protein
MAPRSAIRCARWPCKSAKMHPVEGQTTSIGPENSQMKPNAAAALARRRLLVGVFAHKADRIWLV